MFFPDWLRVSRRNVFCSVRDCSDSGNTTSRRRYIILLVRFLLCKCNPCNGSFVRVLNAVQLVDTQPGRGSGGVECWPAWVRLCVFGKKKSCCSVLIRRAPAPTHTLTNIQPYTHTPPQTHIHRLSMRSYAYTYTPDAADVNFALAQCARRFAAACGLKSLHSLIHVFLYRRPTVS